MSKKSKSLRSEGLPLLDTAGEALVRAYLISKHGAGWVDQLDTAARRSAQFRRALGGVWGWESMTPELRAYAQEQILQIEDISPMVREARARLSAGVATLQSPLERVYPCTPAGSAGIGYDPTPA